MKNKYNILKTLHTFVYSTLIILGVLFYFNIFTLNPQIKGWLKNNPFVPQHQIDTTKGPISQPTVEIKPQPIINYTDTIQLNNIRALFRNGNNSRYVDGQFEEFQIYRDRLARCIYTHFSPKQIKCISSISLIGWESLEDNVVGMTYYTGRPSSAIDVAAKCGDDEIETVMYHEIMHALYFQHISWFKRELQFEWITITDFVSPYAATDICEDFAETGAYFMHGDTLQKNRKFELIRRFFAYTK